MKIEELDDLECNLQSREDDRIYKKQKQLQMVRVDAKRALFGVGARVLFYPTLFYNVFRSKIQTEFRWWDEVDQYLLLGAVPFPKDVPWLKKLGVGGVITLNEPYETLVPSSLYHVYGIDHLLSLTRDYLFAPSFADIGNALCCKTTYVHCKAGRGPSTTIVLCYLVKYKQMTPAAALDYVRSRRPRVLLAPSQWRLFKNSADARSPPPHYLPQGIKFSLPKLILKASIGSLSIVLLVRKWKSYQE